jgi:hypothetical protein
MSRLAISGKGPPFGALLGARRDTAKELQKLAREQ